LIIKTLKPHKHGGTPIPVGSELDVSEAEAQWLIGQGVAEAVTKTTKAKE